MIWYIASPTYYNVISQCVQESELILEGYENTRDLYLLKYIKENLNRLDGLECFILDLAATKDTDSEIISALETLRIMASKTRIIILAINYYPGDELLKNCLNMSIYDIIVTDDFNEIHQEMIHCIQEGKQYKDAIRFREPSENTGKAVKKEEIRQAANKIMFGVSGSQHRIGTTHTAIMLANYLRKRGYMIALAELNQSSCFEQIREEFDERLFDNTFFSMDGVDYYPNVDEEKINGILSKAYNFIVIDFGNFQDCDRITYHKCHEYFMIMGSKPWEVCHAPEVFQLAGEVASKYHYIFNFTRKEVQKDVREGMAGVKSIHFLEHQPDPFLPGGFPDVDELLKGYLPVKTEPEKKGFFAGGILGKRKKYEAI